MSTCGSPRPAFPYRMWPDSRSDGGGRPVHPHSRSRHLPQVRLQLHSQAFGRQAVHACCALAEALLRACALLPEAERHHQVLLPARRPVPPLRRRKSAIPAHLCTFITVGCLGGASGGGVVTHYKGGKGFIY